MGVRRLDRGGGKMPRRLPIAIRPSCHSIHNVRARPCPSVFVRRFEYPKLIRRTQAGTVGRMPNVPLSDALRGVVCEKLFEALAGIMAPSIHHAAAINTIGCYLLCHLTGDDYEVTAGSVVVRQGGAPLALRADASRIEDHEYYLWIERRDAGGRVELVDFAARCWRDWAREVNVLWLGPAPDAVWTFVDALDGAVAQYAPDGKITNMVRTGLHHAFRSPNPPEQVARWESAINTALDRLAHDPRALAYMVERGIAAPAGPPDR